MCTLLFDEFIISVKLEIHYITATIKFGIWWISLVEVQYITTTVRFDGVEFH